MPTDDGVFDDALVLLRSSVNTVNCLTPKARRTNPLGDLRPTKMFWQLFRRSDAIQFLLKEGFLDDAMILLRSCMWDAQRLIYLRQNPADRDALVLGLEVDMITNWENLASIEKAAGRDTREFDRKIQERRTGLENARERRGIGKKKSFPKEGSNLARAIGRSSDQIGHKFFSISSHGASLSPVMEMQVDNENAISLYVRNKNPIFVAYVAWATSEYLFEAAVALGAIQGWDTLADLESQYEATEKRFRKLIGKPADRELGELRSEAAE